MMKRTIVLLWMAFATMAAVAQGTDWQAGTGSLNDPFQISNAQDLQTLATRVNAGNTYSGVFFKMTSDIDLSEVCNAEGERSWVPIGTIGNEGFAGIFDGGNHVITGLYINSRNSRQGLFGYLNGGFISHCVIQGAAVTVSGNYSTAGILVGQSKNGVIENCMVNGANLSGNYDSNLGFIVGSMQSSRVIGNYVTEGVIKSGVHNGAIIGYKSGKSSLRKNYYTASVTGTEGGCDGKDIDNAKNPEGALRTDKTPQEMALSNAINSIQPVLEDMTSAEQPVNLSAPDPTPAPAVTPTPTPAAAPALQATAATQVLKSALKTAPASKPTINTPYIVKTKETEDALRNAVIKGSHQDTEPKDFMSKNFRYYSMCEWQEGMRFMVVPEKVDLLVNTFWDAATLQEVPNGTLRYHIFVYKGHETASNGREHALFTDENDNKDYYFELPLGTFDDYCYSREGVPTLAYLGDVDKARELLMNEQMLTRNDIYRIDSDDDPKGYKEVVVTKNDIVTVKAVGVGSRAFPVKIIVEDETGLQYYQNVAMSKTNCGMRDEEFNQNNEKYLFQGSFAYGGGVMAIFDNLSDYIGKTVHTNHATSMSSRGSGKMRVVKVPRFTGFIIDAITPVQNSHYFTLTMRESESRRVFTKDVAFSELAVKSERKGNYKEDFFGYVFGMGEGAARETSLEIRAAIREGRVIRGMTKDQVELAMGEANEKVREPNGEDKWMYNRSNGVIFEVWFDAHSGIVRDNKARLSAEESKRRMALMKSNNNKKSSRKAAIMQDRAGGRMTTGTPLQ